MWIKAIPGTFWTPVNGFKDLQGCVGRQSTIERSGDTDGWSIKGFPYGKAG
jgi:hypothetical protein